MKKVVRTVLFIFYIGALLYVVFFARRREAMPHRPKDTLVNLVPVVNQVKSFQTLNPDDPREEKNFFFNLFGNIALFVPLSIFLGSATNQHEKKVLLTALALSCLIELVQYIFVLGVADVDDVLLNMTGAYLGWLLYQKFSARSSAAAVSH